MCAISVHTNPIYGWRELDRKSLVKLASCLSWPHLVFGVGTCEVDKVLISPDTKLKDPLASVIAPWLLILIQSVSLEVTQEKALDSADWIKPKQYDPDAKQVNAKEWVGLFVTLERANGFCICEWSQADLWIPYSLASVWDWNANYIFIPPLSVLRFHSLNAKL